MIHLTTQQCNQLHLQAVLPTDNIQLTEQQRIYPSDARFAELVALCHLSKNLYNTTLYQIRQQFFENKTFLNYATLAKRFVKENQADFRALPAKVAQQTMKLVEQNFRSFFGSLCSTSIEHKINLPRYYPTGDSGLAPVIYTQQALSKKQYQLNQEIKLSQTNLCFCTKRKIDWSAINQVRIIPNSKQLDKLKYITIEVVYSIQAQSTSPIDYYEQIEILEKITKTGKVQKKKYIHKSVQFDEQLINFASLDLNLNQFALATSCGGNLYNIRPAKAVNTRFNKLKAKYQSILDRLIQENKQLKNHPVFTLETAQAVMVSNQQQIDKIKNTLFRLSLKRERWLKNFGHQLTTQLANQLMSLKVNLLIIGKNPNFKQDVNLGKRLNQQFCSLPLIQWVNLLHYKLQLRGIACLMVEESYTSKVDFLAKEHLFSFTQKDKPKDYQFTGKRVHRGLFYSQSGVYLNADINGAWNIARKVLGDEIYTKVNFKSIRGSCPVKTQVKLH